MKENVLDVLMFLFENFMYDDSELDPDRETLQSTLLEAGFHHPEIEKAFDWLEDLASRQYHSPSPQLNDRAIRIFSEREMDRLDTDCRGFLLYLEQNGIIDTTSRELIVDRAMALDDDDFDLERLKWVILMVLFNQPGQEAAYEWLEDLVFENPLSELAH